MPRTNGTKKKGGKAAVGLAKATQSQVAKVKQVKLLR